MTAKVFSIDHQKRLDGYLTALRRLEKKWREDLSDLKRINEISEEEAKVESEVLDLFWDFVRRSLCTLQRSRS